MLQYKNILLASDLAASSEAVAQQAHDLAKESNATLHVIHVMEHSPIAYGGEFSIPIDINLEQELEANARTALQTLGDKFGIQPAHQYLERGSAKLAVQEKAQAIPADLIVVGSRDLHGIEWMMGSRANAILHFAPCDVWVVKVQGTEE